MSELLPCPFCGNTNIKEPTGDNGYMCTRCGSEGFGGWNSRPMETALRKTITDLKIQTGKNSWEALKIQAKLSATIADLEAKLKELRQLNDEFYLLLVDNPDTKLMADKIMVNIFGKCKPSDIEVSTT